jgi:hypothetical protein
MARDEICQLTYKTIFLQSDTFVYFALNNVRMRRLILLSVMLSLSVYFTSAFAQKEIFLKQIEFKLDKISNTDYENEYFMTIKLNKGSTYKFKISNHRENYAGLAIIEVMDADKLILTNQLNEKYFETLSLVCNKTAFYDILVRYKDKRLGNSVIDIMLMQ